MLMPQSIYKETFKNIKSNGYSVSIYIKGEFRMEYKRGGNMQADAAYLQVEKLNKDKWETDEKKVDSWLEELKDKHGKKPNIVFILADDISNAGITCYGGGKLLGTETPNLDRMASEGMKFLSFYSEPSCTPTRIALLTGRHPVRTGVDEVLWPGSKQGLSSDETTIATLLSDAGYDTAFYGKWHVGEAEESLPQNHGFDDTFYTIYNAAPFVWGDKKIGIFEWPENEEFRKKYHIQGIQEAKRGEKAKEVEKLSADRLKTYEETLTDKTTNFIKDHAKNDNPFFCYFAASKIDYWGVHPDWEGKSPAGTPFADEMMEHDHNVGRVLQTIRDEGIEENTLVVWMSDNGPMYEAGIETSGASFFEGGKGQVTEGGMRTPAIAWWPGTIKAGQDPMDIISVTDMFTTAARLGGAKENIPDDRVTDGVDQTCLLVHGEHNSHRDYMFYYSGPELGAVRKRQYKMTIGKGHGGLPGGSFANVIANPIEKQTSGGTIALPYMSLAVPFKDIITEHKLMMKRFPNRVLQHSEDTGYDDRSALEA